jgi:hypothetical protein
MSKKMVEVVTEEAVSNDIVEAPVDFGEGKTAILRQLVEMNGGWQPGDGVLYGCWHTLNDEPIWAHFWNIGGHNYSPEEIQPLATMSDAEIFIELDYLAKKIARLQASPTYTDICLGLIDFCNGRPEWRAKVEAGLKRIRGTYQGFTSKQYPDTSGKIHAGFAPAGWKV